MTCLWLYALVAAVPPLPAPDLKASVTKRCKSIGWPEGKTPMAPPGFRVTLFETATSFLESLPKLEFGCVVSDVRMPGIDGIELLKRMKAANSRFPILIMTGHGDVPLAVDAMKLGAVDFLEKPFEDERLTTMIEGGLRQAEPAARNEAVTQDIAARIASLSPRERQVMDGLIAGLSNKLIAREYDISPRTIEVYRANVMTKMQANSLSELVRLAMRAGLLND